MRLLLFCLHIASSSSLDIIWCPTPSSPVVQAAVFSLLRLCYIRPCPNHFLVNFQTLAPPTSVLCPDERMAWKPSRSNHRAVRPGHPAVLRLFVCILSFVFRTPSPTRFAAACLSESYLAPVSCNWCDELASYNNFEASMRIRAE